MLGQIIVAMQVLAAISHFSLDLREPAKTVVDWLQIFRLKAAAETLWKKDHKEAECDIWQVEHLRFSCFMWLRRKWILNTLHAKYRIVAPDVVRFQEHRICHHGVLCPALGISDILCRDRCWVATEPIVPCLFNNSNFTSLLSFPWNAHNVLAHSP